MWGARPPPAAATGASAPVSHTQRTSWTRAERRLDLKEEHFPKRPNHPEAVI